MQINLYTKSQVWRELSISFPTIMKLINNWEINEYAIGKKTWWFKKITLISLDQVKNLKKY